jgi:hypothetical protein
VNPCSSQFQVPGATFWFPVPGSRFPVPSSEFRVRSSRFAGLEFPAGVRTGAWPSSAPTPAITLSWSLGVVGERALNGLLGGLVVVVVDLLVVARFPVDEHADHDAVVVGLVARNHAALDRVDHGAGHGGLRRAEHLHGLLAPLMVTLLNSSVSGLAGRFGATTARRVVNPSLLFVSALQNAAPAGPDFEPMIRSMCATSLPSPTSDSPMKEVRCHLEALLSGSWRGAARRADRSAQSVRRLRHRTRPHAGRPGGPSAVSQESGIGSQEVLQPSPLRPRHMTCHPHAPDPIITREDETPSILLAS